MKKHLTSLIIFTTATAFFLIIFVTQQHAVTQSCTELGGSCFINGCNNGYTTIDYSSGSCMKEIGSNYTCCKPPATNTNTCAPKGQCYKYNCPTTGSWTLTDDTCGAMTDSACCIPKTTTPPPEGGGNPPPGGGGSTCSLAVGNTTQNFTEGGQYCYGDSHPGNGNPINNGPEKCGYPITDKYRTCQSNGTWVEHTCPSGNKCGYISSTDVGCYAFCALPLQTPTPTPTATPACPVSGETNPHYKCNTATQSCEIETNPVCGVSSCNGTSDTTTCKSTLPNCDATNSTSTTCTPSACTGVTNTCGPQTQSCSYTGPNCIQAVNPSVPCGTFNRCGDTAGNVCDPNTNTCVPSASASPSTSPSTSPSGSSNPSPTATPVCNLPNLNPHFECQQNTCVKVDTCAENSDGCTLAGGSCGIPDGNTSLSFTIGLDAIGVTGDRPNPYDWTSSNQDPLRPIRNITVEVLDANYNSVLNKPGIIAYDLDSGMFFGTVDIGKTLTSGPYIVKITSDGYLRRLIPGAQNITAGQQNDMPEVSLVVGDITQENTLTILDYNILMSCSIYSADNKGACNEVTGYKTLSDLEDNGLINQYDYNLFVREYSVQNGE